MELLNILSKYVKEKAQTQIKIFQNRLNYFIFVITQSN